jgi:hypothetical protein
LGKDCPIAVFKLTEPLETMFLKIHSFTGNEPPLAAIEVHWLLPFFYKGVFC